MVGVLVGWLGFVCLMWGFVVVWVDGFGACNCCLGFVLLWFDGG